MRRTMGVLGSVVSIAILAAGMAGMEALTQPAAATTATVPSPPLQVSVANTATSTRTVTWAAPIFDGGAAITDYEIETREVGTLTWVAVSHTPSASTSIVVSNLSSSATYVARVRAVNSVGSGPWNITGSRIDGGNAFACAVVDEGTIQCWGSNTFGELGNGVKGLNALRLVPVESSPSVITGENASSTAVAVSAGTRHACALMGDGTIKCWGDNTWGQLGDGSTAEALTAVSVSGITGLTPDA